jgi:hypothetical protein
LTTDKLFELRKEFYPNYSTAQEYLDRNYPSKERKNIQELDLRGKELEGDLDLGDFTYFQGEGQNAEN